MAVLCKRRVVRVTSEIHGPTQQPFVLRIDPGGRTVGIKIKGRRTWFVVTTRQIFTQGGWNAAAAIKAEKQRLKAERKKARAG